MNLRPTRCVVLGAGGHCRAVLGLLLEHRDVGYEVLGIVDVGASSRPKTSGPERIMGIPVLGSMEVLAKCRNDGITDAFLGVGDNEQRRRYFNICVEQGFELPNLISRTAYVGYGAEMGRANVVCPMAFVGPMARLGDNNLLNTQSIVEHESVVGDHCHVGPAALVAGRVHIGSMVFLGLGAKIIDQRAICDRTTVGAGAVVLADITEPGGAYIGVPAHRLAKQAS